jgi:DNA-binding winged helix-turn-helix (wHTH) protein/tetratricopeptide (TPR) repeat protein
MFELSEARFELRRAGVPVPVQPKVVDLLLHLVRHRDRVVLKDELLRALWPDVLVTEASLSKAVAGARRALGDGAEEPRHVLTVRGRGFRFVASVAEEAPDAGARPGARGTGDFVGRADIQGAVAGALASARAGDGRLVLLAGEAGMGKTRTAQEIAARARASGARVLTGWCLEEKGAPDLWPWAQALRQVAADGDLVALGRGLGDGAADLAELVPSLAGVAPAVASRSRLAPEQARFRLFDTITEVLRRAAGARPLLVVLDDFHRADRASLALLGFLSQELAGSGMVLLVTCREEALLEGHLLVGFSRRPTSLALRLEGLAREEVARLVATEAGEPVDDRVAAAIHEASEGNPFFVKELARALAARGPLDTPAALDAMPLPAGVREVLRQRLDRLSAGCRDVLVPAALIGRDVEVGVVARVTGLPAEQVLERLDEASAARVVVGRPGGYRFAHALVREALLEPVAAAEEARLHRRIGEALEAHHAGDLEPYLAQLAHHFAAGAPSGGLAQAADYARRAGHRAARLLACDEAAAHYRRALELMALQGAAGERQRCELLLSLGEAQIAAGDPREGRTTLRRAAEVARGLSSPEHLGRAALAAGGLPFSAEVGVQDAELEEWLQGALDGLPAGASTLRTRLLARLAVALAWGHSWERVGDLAREAVESARRVDDPHALGYALYVHRWTRSPPGELEAKLGDSDEILRLARQSGARELELAARSCRFLDLIELGRLPDADCELDLYERLVAEARVPRYRWRARFYRAMRAFLDGRFPEAEQLIFQARDEEQRFMPADAGQVFGGQLTLLRWEQGRVAEIEPLIQAAADRFPTFWGWRGGLALARVELGRTDEARATLEGLGGGDLTRLPRGLNWIAGLATLAEVCLALGDRERAAQLYGLLRPCAPRTVMIGAGGGCWGALDRFLGLLATTTGDFEAAVRHFEAARAMDARLGARPWVGWTEHAWARMLRLRDRPGDRAAAREHLAQARAIADSLGMTRLAAQSAELATRLR